MWFTGICVTDAAVIQKYGDNNDDNDYVGGI